MQEIHFSTSDDSSKSQTHSKPCSKKAKLTDKNQWGKLPNIRQVLIWGILPIGKQNGKSYINSCIGRSSLKLRRISFMAIYGILRTRFNQGF